MVTPKCDDHLYNNSNYLCHINFYTHCCTDLDVYLQTCPPVIWMGSLWMDTNLSKKAYWFGKFTRTPTYVHIFTRTFLEWLFFIMHNDKNLRI